MNPDDLALRIALEDILDLTPEGPPAVQVTHAVGVVVYQNRQADLDAELSERGHGSAAE